MTITEIDRDALKARIAEIDAVMAAYQGDDVEHMVEIATALLRAIPIPHYLEPVVDGAIETIRRVVREAAA